MKIKSIFTFLITRQKILIWLSSGKKLSLHIKLANYILHYCIEQINIFSFTHFIILRSQAKLHRTHLHVLYNTRVVCNTITEFVHSIQCHSCWPGFHGKVFILPTFISCCFYRAMRILKSPTLLHTSIISQFFSFNQRYNIMSYNLRLKL